MASLQKILITRWVNSQGDRVPPSTPGATRVSERSAKWYACWREGSKQVRIPLATDKSSSQAMLGDLLRNKDRAAARLVDPHQPHLDRSLAGHMEDYLATIKASGKVTNDKYFTEKRRILTTIFSESGMKTLSDLTGEAVNSYMTRLTCSAGTRRVHHTAINAFADWLVAMKRVAANPLMGVARPAGGKIMRKRRALSPDELQRLLDAARQRPLASAEWNSGGRRKADGRKPPKPVRHLAQLREDTRDELVRIGRERALLYKTAVYTGLRKGELAELRVKYLDLDRKPYPSVELPGEFTKNGEDARLLLVPALAGELRELVAGKGQHDPVFNVPEKMVPVMKRDLKQAGIAYQDDRGRYADFHALRKSAGTMLGVAGVPVRIRQLFMRHGDIRLTMQTYDDSDYAEMEEAVRALEKLGLR